MRVSSNMLSNNFLLSLNRTLERQNKLQEQMTDGKAIHRPSDDPVRTVRSLKFNMNLAQNEQYTGHVQDAISWMETTDAAISDLSSLMMQAKELAVKAVAPNPDMALDAIAAELDGIINQIVEIGNTKIGDRYVFAGQMDKTQPFTRRTVTAADGTTYDAVVYSGDFNKISMRIQSGVSTPAQDSVNLTGRDLFGPLHSVQENGKQFTTVSVLNDLIKIKEALNGKTPSPNSNPAGGDVKQISDEDHKAVTLKIDTLDDSGLPTTASYSTDGGQSWKAATADPANAGQFIIPAADMGTTDNVLYAISAVSYNKVGDTYALPAAQKSRDLQWVSKVALDIVDHSHNKVLIVQTQLGARMSMYERAEAMLKKNNVTITEGLSANEDLDIAKATIDFKTSEAVYRAALSVGAKIMPPSLVDFLR